MHFDLDQSRRARGAGCDSAAGANGLEKPLSGWPPAATGRLLAFLLSWPKRALIHEPLDLAARDAVARHQQSDDRVVEQIAQGRFFVAGSATGHGAPLWPP